MLDVQGTLQAAALLTIYFLPSGYVLGWLTNLLQFRSRSGREKLLLSLPLSLVCATVLANIVGRFLAPSWVQACFLGLAAAAVLIFAVHRRKNNLPWKLTRPMALCLGLAVLWVIAVIICVVDVQIGHKLYPSSMLWDYGVRIAFIHSALRTGVPPANPFCYLAHHAPTARYYYYWNVLCSYPARLAHLDPRYVLYGSSIWTGFSLAALIPIYLKDFLAVQNNLKRKSAAGILLLTVTGLDVLPNLYEFFRGKTVYPDMEWWDPVQVTSWQDALIWVPHHVAALIACLIGFLSLWSVRQDKTSGWKVSRGNIFIAGGFATLAFAAAAGLSVYVTFTFALFLLAWGLHLLWKRYFVDFFLYLGTACVTVLISIPYLHDLLPQASQTSAAPSLRNTTVASAHFIQFGLRELPGFLSTPYFLKQHGFSHALLLAPFGVIVVYLLEFGFFAIVACARLRTDLRDRRKWREEEIACWTMAGVAMFVITFLRSSVIANNDLAYRSAMIAQFVLLLWGAEYLDTWLFDRQAGVPTPTRWKNAVIVSSLVLGFIGTMYSLFILRGYTLLDDRGYIPNPAAWLPPPHHIGEKIFAVRELYEKLQILPPDAIVQYNPMATDFLPFLMYDRFQAVDAFPNCGTAFGGDTALCMPAQQTLAQLFTNGSLQNMQHICHQLSIDVLIAQNTDAVWQNPQSWVWTRTPIDGNESVRAFRCP
jgi:hypothetical protein